MKQARSRLRPELRQRLAFGNHDPRQGGAGTSRFEDAALGGLQRSPTPLPVRRARRGGVALAAVLLLAHTAPAHAGAVWCTLAGNGTTYLSSIKDIADSSRSQVRIRSSRFVRVVNAGHATAFAQETRACRVFADHGAAARALATYRATLGDGTVEQVVY